MTRPVRLVREQDIRALIGPGQALAAVREAFADFARGQATLPGAIGLAIPQHRGEVHVKGAFLHRSTLYSIKEATGFYDNPRRNLPVGSGVVLAFDASTGFLDTILLDNGYLTDLRTGAAGALAADLLARPAIDTASFLGCGAQARFQLEALLGVRRPRRVLVWGRSPDRVAAFATEMGQRLDVAIHAAASARQAVEESDLVVTTTPSRTPIVESAWLHPGLHLTAVGSDASEKCELEPAALARADLVVADSIDQCLRLGEIHHAVRLGVFDPACIHGELGELAAGTKPGRRSDAEITIADLTGVGIQDAAVADLVVAAARSAGAGQLIEP